MTEARFKPENLQAAVKRVRKAVGPWWRRTPWGRQVTNPDSRTKRVRKDTSLAYALEIAPGGMVHVHALVYGEYVAQAELARAWGKALGMNGPAVVHIRSVDPEDPTRGIREALKCATKGQGKRGEQAARAAAVEYAFAHVHRVAISGALRGIRCRSVDPDAEDVQAEDVHDECEAACEACGALGSWVWERIVSHKMVEMNDGWGVVLPRSERSPP